MLVFGKMGERVGCRDHRVCQSGARARVQLRVSLRVTKFGFAAIADEPLVQEWLIKYYDYRASLVLQCNERSPKRLDGQECARAVDRVDHPDKAAGTRCFAEFFADNAVLRKPDRNTASNRLFGAPVRFRDRIVKSR